MTYTPPSVQVFQEFETPTTAQQPLLYPVIIGPRYDFYTYANDKATIALGSYVRTADTDYSYPNLSATATVKQDSVKLYFDNAYLRYFRKLNTDTTYQFRTVYPYRNRIRSAADVDSQELVMVTTTNRLGTTFTRDTAFLKDVAAGDGIFITTEINGTDYSVLSKVASIIYDEVAAVTGSPVANSGNQGVQVHSVLLDSSTVVGDDTNTPGGTYVGSLAAGVVSDTYTVEVETGGAYATQTITADNGLDGNTVAIDATSYWDKGQDEVYTIEIIVGGAPNVAKFKYTSNSGLDDGPVSGTIVSGAGTVPSPIHSIGTYGLKVTFDDSDATDIFTVGSSWEITCTAGTATLSVTSASGTDDVTSYVARTDGFAIPVGSGGATLALADGGDGVLTAGDKWVLACTAVFAVPSLTMGGTYTGATDVQYFLEVTKGGAWGTAEISVTSSGVDSSGPTVVTAAATAISFGSKGLTVSFAANTQGGLLLGDKWTVAATASANGPAKGLELQNDLPNEILTAAPTLTGPTDIAAGTDDIQIATTAYTDSLNVLSERNSEIYYIEITKAGAAGVAEYTVTSQSGLDDQTATIISAFGTGTKHPVGTLGLEIYFIDTDVDTDMDLGQSWLIQVEKPNLDVDLYIIKNNVEVPRYRTNTPTDTAWETSASDVSIEANIYLTDSSWASGGSTVPIPVHSASQYLAYSALRTDNTSSLYTMSGAASDATIASTIGQIHPSNPIAYGVKKALLNSNGRPVKYVMLSSDDLTGYTAALDLIKELRDIYAIVPLTQNTTIQDAVETHVMAMSQPEENRWRVSIINRDLATYIRLYDTYANTYTGVSEDYLATVTDDPLTANTQYTLLLGNPSQSINFLTDGVSVGDILEFGFSTDLNGTVVWTDYTITAVRSETSLTFSPALTAAVTSSSKFRIRRSYTKQQQAEAIRDAAIGINNRRVMLVYPHQVGDGSYTVPGYYLAAAIGGMTVGNPPHAGFTNKTVLGFDDMSYSYEYFTRDQLNTIADGGVTIVTQLVSSDTPFIRHQLMTKRDTLFDQEYSLVKNPDYISYYFWNNHQDFIGQWNINAGTLEAIYTRSESVLNTLIASEYEKLGNIIISGEIISVKQHETFKDRVEVEVELVVPAPLNNLVITLTFTV